MKQILLALSLLVSASSTILGTARIGDYRDTISLILKHIPTEDGANLSNKIMNYLFKDQTKNPLALSIIANLLEQEKKTQKIVLKILAKNSKSLTELRKNLEATYSLIQHLQLEKQIPRELFDTNFPNILQLSKTIKNIENTNEIYGKDGYFVDKKTAQNEKIDLLFIFAEKINERHLSASESISLIELLEELLIMYHKKDFKMLEQRMEFINEKEAIDAISLAEILRLPKKFSLFLTHPISNQITPYLLDIMPSAKTEKEIQANLNTIKCIFGQNEKIFKLKNTSIKNIQEADNRPITETLVTPDQKKFINTSFDNTLKLFDAQTRRLLQTIHAHKKPIDQIIFADIGNNQNLRIITKAQDNTAKLWVLEEDNIRYLQALDEETVKQIAQKQYLTITAVEYILQRTCKKLGINKITPEEFSPYLKKKFTKFNANTLRLFSTDTRRTSLWQKIKRNIDSSITKLQEN